MKRCLVLLSALLLTVSVADAQTKVLEKSSKKVPEWLGTAPDEYLIVSVVASSLGEAQTKTQEEIVERIITAVATNVNVSTRNEMSEENYNGDIVSKEKYARLSQMKTANLPFIKDVSMSEVEDVYWVKLQDKKTKKEYYEYSVKYPFPDRKRKQLIAEFERIDAEKNAQYKALEQKINAIEDIDEIKAGIMQLESLEAYFFDDVRLSQAKGLKARYKDLYNNISVTGMFVSPGKYQCQVLLNGFPVKVSATPKVTSNCAGQLGVSPADGAFVVTYDAVDCLPEEENIIKILFKINGKKYEHLAYLSESGGAGVSGFSVVPEGRIVLTADSIVVADRKLFDINIRLTLNNRSAKPFGLKALELHVPELTAPLIFDDINLVYETKGVIPMTLFAEGVFTVKTVKKSALSMVDGAVILVNPDTGALERKRLSLPYVTNWE